MKHITRVNIVSGDRIDRVVANRDSALARAGPRARNIERGDGAMLSTHEAVIDIARVHVVSRDRPDALMFADKVPWKGPVPAPGTSNVVIVPSEARTNP